MTLLSWLLLCSEHRGVSIAVQLSAKANKEPLCFPDTVKLPYRSKPPTMLLSASAEQKKNDEPTQQSPTLQIDIIPPSYCDYYCVRLQN